MIIHGSDKTNTKGKTGKYDMPTIGPYSLGHTIQHSSRTNLLLFMQKQKQTNIVMLWRGLFRVKLIVFDDCVLVKDI